MVNTLFLRLEGPLQSWGERARWSERDTAPEPTKSGVVGLLACALGIRDDDAIVKLGQSLAMGCRCDRPGTRLRDYHTVVSGVLTAEGKIKRNAATGRIETVVSIRHYLCDASFTVALQADDTALIGRLAQAVQTPVWPLYLGRKSCPPALPVYAGTGTFSTIEQALAHAPLLLRPGELKAPRRAVVETPSQGARRFDNLRVPSLRLYAPRYTTDQLITAAVFEETEDDIPLMPVSG